MDAHHDVPNPYVLRDEEPLAQGGSLQNSFSPRRIIGIRHRVKATSQGEARPTQVALLDGGVITLMTLKTEDDELQFVREVLREGDAIGMVLGGSGDSLAYALSNRGREVGARVYRIPAYLLKNERGDADKDADAALLVEILNKKWHNFYEVRERDRALIEVSESYHARMEAMKARIACEQRLRTNFIGRIFRKPEGHYPEGAIEDLFNAEKATNAILSTLEKEEKGRERDLTRALQELDVYTEIFEGVEGCGMSIAAGIISAVGDIRRFETKAKFKAFLGVHVMTDGRIPRRRHGQTSNWNPAGRQALYLFGEQMNRRPDSVWGKKLRAYKVKLRGVHPHVVVEGGKKRYTDGHIHKMALWRTITKFAEWLYDAWWELERRQEREVRRAA